MVYFFDYQRGKQDCCPQSYEKYQYENEKSPT